MKDLNNNRGQALIETAIVLVLLLIILFGITEFSRAWFVRNSLKNGVRSGARLAAVTCGITIPKFSGLCTSWPDSACQPPPAVVPANCNGSGSENNNAIIAAVCCSLGVSKEQQDNTIVTVKTLPQAPSGLTADVITVSASSTFHFVIGGGIWPWPESTPIGAEASMRHE
jgi:hypothetical protein